MAAALGLTLPVSLGSNGYFQTTTDILTQLRTNLTNLLLTRKGERIFQPTFGCDIHSYVFENQTDDGVSNIQASIEAAVQTWMPFITIQAINVVRDPDNHILRLQISFALKTNANVGATITLAF